MEKVMEADEKFYWFWLCNIPGIGNKRIIRLLDVFEDARAIYDADEKILKTITILKDKDIKCISDSRRNSRIYTEYLNLKKKNIRLITFNDKDYPEKLKNIYDSPACLYLKGKMPDENKLSAAVVGARNCSEYGRQTAFAIGRQLALAGVSVISGMARGIDGAAHKGVLSVSGYTLGVLACGPDICYPRENIGIYSHMETSGGIISEFPPGTEPVPNHFPLRNRIISGLADVIVVVEAGEKSGSLITADMALEQNKIVMAVPGRICDRLSAGCNNLIKLGAEVVTSPKDILEILNCEVFINKPENKKNIILLAREEEMLYSCLDLIPKNLNTIIEETGLDVSAVMEFLISLEFKGLAREISRGYYVRTRVEI